jgi:iron(III) transport system permease protein
MSLATGQLLRRISRPGVRLAISQHLSGESVMLVALLAVFGYLIVPPLIAVVQTSFHTVDARGLRGEATLVNYVDLLGRGDLLQPFLNTLWFSIASTALALLIGGGLAWIVGRTNTPLRGLGHAVAFMSLAIPFVLYTIAWLLILGQRGPINTLLMGWLGLSSAPINAYTIWSMIAVEGFLWSPLAFLMLSASFRSMDPALEESAMICGGGIWQTLTRVTLPLSAPAIASIGLLVFIRAFESFEIPALVGMPGRVYVLTTRVFQSTRSTPPDYGGASAYAVVLMAFVLVALYFYSRATRQASRFETISGKGFRPRLMDLGRWRYLASAAILLYFLVLLVLPLALILWASMMPFYQPPSIDALRLATTKNYAAVLTQPSYLTAIRNTLTVGVLSAATIVLLTALASWVVVKSKVRGRLWLDQLGAMPLVFPGIVLGLAIMQLYLALPLLPVYGTLWILGIAYVTRYLPYGMRYSNAGLLQIHHELEEAASVSGAGFWRSYRTVVLPLLAPVLLASWVFVFLLSTKELSMSVLLASPRSQVMSVAFFDLWNNGQVTEVAAFGVLWAAALSLVTAILFLVGRRYGLQVQQR